MDWVSLSVLAMVAETLFSIASANLKSALTRRTISNCSGSGGTETKVSFKLVRLRKGRAVSVVLCFNCSLAAPICKEEAMYRGKARDLSIVILLQF